MDLLISVSRREWELSIHLIKLASGHFSCKEVKAELKRAPEDSMQRLLGPGSHRTFEATGKKELWEAETGVEDEGIGS